jgi:hypothetical protein
MVRFIRIPLTRRAIENPNVKQLVSWAKRENILQRMSPREAQMDPLAISIATIERLTALYKASLERWKFRNPPAPGNLSEIVRNSLNSILNPEEH